MKYFLSAAVLLVSVTSLASKARLTSLSNSFHVVDPQTIFGNPLDLMGLKSFIAIESGSTTPAGSTDNAEGIISFGINEQTQMAVSLGHVDDSIMLMRNVVNATAGTTFSSPQNPVHLFYGYKTEDTVYAFNMAYSHKDDKTNNLKEGSALASFGVQSGNFQIYGLTSLINAADMAGGKKFDGSEYFNLAGRYILDTITLRADLYSTKAKTSTNGIEDLSLSYQSVIVGLVDIKGKEGEAEYFYGVNVISSNLKNRTTGKDLRQTNLPVWFGIETKTSDWLIVRGSIQQTVLIAQSKDEAAFPAGDGYLAGANGLVNDFSAAPNNTTAAFGVALTMNNVAIDGTFKGLVGAAPNQQIDGDNFLSQVGLTYNY